MLTASPASLRGPLPRATGRVLIRVSSVRRIIVFHQSRRLTLLRERARDRSRKPARRHWSLRLQSVAVSAVIVAAATLVASALAAPSRTATSPSSTFANTASPGANPSSTFVGFGTPGGSGEGDGGSESDNPGSFGPSSLFLILLAIGATLYFAIRLAKRPRADRGKEPKQG